MNIAGLRSGFVNGLADAPSSPEGQMHIQTPGHEEFADGLALHQSMNFGDAGDGLQYAPKERYKKVYDSLADYGSETTIRPRTGDKTVIDCPDGTHPKTETTPDGVEVTCVPDEPKKGDKKPPKTANPETAPILE